MTPYLPSPPGFGGQQRLHGLISGLSTAHDVSVLSLVDAHEDQTDRRIATQAYCLGVRTVPNCRTAAGGMAKRLMQLESLLSPWSYERKVHHEAAFAYELERLVSTERFDVVHFEFPHMAAYGTRRSASRSRGPLYVLDEHNIEHNLGRQAASRSGSTLRRVYGAINVRKIRIEEKQAWAVLDGCTVTSARDEQRLLADAPLTRTAVIPNGVDLHYFSPRPEASSADASPTLLFFGAIDYYPNTDGLLYFLTEIAPLLGGRSPRAKTRIVGRRPPDAILAYRGPEVDVTGAVDDVRPYIAEASVVVVPLRMGGGTRLKILEAMAMGKAIVSTSLGAEGLDAVPGRDLVLADDPRAFAAQIGRVLDDGALRARLGAAARRFVCARYGWPSSVERLAAFYRELLEARARAG